MTTTLRLSILEKLTTEGRLQYPSIRKVEMALKTSWFKRIYKSKQGWADFPNMYIMNGVYGVIHLEILQTRICNDFWKDATRSLHTSYNGAKCNGKTCRNYSIMVHITPLLETFLATFSCYYHT